jgi:hypothetical protein
MRTLREACEWKRRIEDELDQRNPGSNSQETHFKVCTSLAISSSDTSVGILGGCVRAICTQLCAMNDGM